MEIIALVTKANKNNDSKKFKANKNPTNKFTMYRENNNHKM